jgi:hypothetical protein
MDYNWFKLKVKYLSQNDKGEVKKHTAEYILKAVSFTDAEAKLLNNMALKQWEYNLVSCAKFNIQEVVFDEAYDDFFKVKTVISSVDEKGKEIKVIDNLIIQSNTVDQVNKKLKNKGIDLESVENIAKTKIIDCFQ